MNTVIDTKIRDTSADQILRFTLRALNAIWVLILTVGVWPVGLLWLAGTIFVTVQLSNRRKVRYSRNAHLLARLNQNQLYAGPDQHLL